MDVAAVTAFDLPMWQAILEHEASAFSGFVPGASMGFVPRHTLGPNGKPRSSAMPRVPALEMLVWERGSVHMTACQRSYRGLVDCACDVLFFFERDALEAVLSRAHDDPFGELKRRICAGNLLLMVLRTRQALRERGYEDFLESLGLPFMGACR